MRGICRAWNVRKGYGFLKGEDNEAYFAHYSELKTTDSYKQLAVGQEVEFDFVVTPKGRRAVNIKPVFKNAEVVREGSKDS